MKDMQRFAGWRTAIQDTGLNFEKYDEVYHLAPALSDECIAIGETFYGRYKGVEWDLTVWRDGKIELSCNVRGSKIYLEDLTPDIFKQTLLMLDALVEHWRSKEAEQE
jgi:hypothetical protein